MELLTLGVHTLDPLPLHLTFDAAFYFGLGRGHLRPRFDCKAVVQHGTVQQWALRVADYAKELYGRF